MTYVQHLSVRVPWHDAGWDGSVCRDPLGNSSCVLLTHIGKSREDVLEVENAGGALADLDPAKRPCVAERATFLSPRDYEVHSKHPYAWHAALNIQETTLRLPAWSVHAIPYYWLHAENVQDVLKEHRLDSYEEEREELVADVLKHRPNWVMHGANQKAVLDTFFQDVRPHQSLVFFYLKHSPFEDASSRLLVGAGLVDKVDLPGPWPTSGENAFPNHMWETAVRHTLRPDGTGGILLPLQELAELASEGVDVSAALAHAPQSGREFSYVTEHVPADTAVASLMELRRAAQAAAELGCAAPSASLEWLDEQLGLTWRRRGPAPGLPAVLKRLGWSQPAFAARTISTALGEKVDPWPIVVDALERRPAPDEVAALVTEQRRGIWSRTPELERKVFALLVRFDLSADEVGRVLDGDTSGELAFEDLLADPYLLVTATIDDDEPLAFPVVDRGCSPDGGLALRHPLPIEVPFDDPNDARRLEAALIWVTARAQEDGHTVVPLEQAQRRIDELVVAQAIDATNTVLRGADLLPDQLVDRGESGLGLVATELDDGTYAYKLDSAARRVEAINAFLENLERRDRHPVPDEVDAGIDRVLDEDHTEEQKAATEQEEQARTEKRSALRELYASRFTVLNGPAGTGKTTLVRALVQRPEIIEGSVLLLAPTGKACVQLQHKVGFPARTLASFLAGTGRYSGAASRYRATDDASTRQSFGTVVVDEASMLTEDMLDALLDALHPPDRLVLVGDPRQLPPIGAGRPFVDLENAARQRHGGEWPHVVPGWAELTVLRRQREGRTGARDDLMLARWFSGDDLPESYDEVWQRLRADEPMPNLRAVPWNGRPPKQVIDDVLAEECDVTREDDGRSFAASYGATLGQYINYNSAPSQCERWQILSPVRGQAHGTVQLNRHLKLTYRQNEQRKASARNRHVPKPLGSEQIVLGDKVVNLANQTLNAWSREEGKTRAYVANGEIGVVTGQITSRGKKAPRTTQVEFSSQPGRRITVNRVVGGDGDASVELAWALTVHKSQGSEFKTVILVLPAEARTLSRELVYTALTRQTDRIVLCHEGPLDELMTLSRATGSDTARRLTDLKRRAKPVPVRGTDGTELGLLDAGLVHVTGSGKLVRSKNEVIIAGILDELSPGSWEYEKPVYGSDGRTRFPDFTIATPGGGLVYWEHLGMMNVPEYAAGWERKKAWYAEQGILPLDEGGGPKGTLVWTDDRTGVDASQWTSLARSFLSDGPSRPSRGRGRRLR